MTQASSLISFLDPFEDLPAALACPSCELCKMATRFVGLEAVAGNRRADLCTYECIACGHAQVTLVPRTNGHNGHSL